MSASSHARVGTKTRTIVVRRSNPSPNGFPGSRTRHTIADSSPACAYYGNNSQTASHSLRNAHRMRTRQQLDAPTRRAVSAIRYVNVGRPQLNFFHQKAAAAAVRFLYHTNQRENLACTLTGLRFGCAVQCNMRSQDACTYLQQFPCNSD